MKTKTRYAFDTEFLEDGKTIELISIGIACEDGREYYAVSQDMPLGRILNHAWLMENVVSSLPMIERIVIPGSDIDVLALRDDDPMVKPHAQIRDEVEKFLLGGEHEPELWAFCAAYDHVVLAQLWGPMASLPDGIPHQTFDLVQEIDRLHAWADMPRQEGVQHHALEDARHALLMLRHVDLQAETWLVEQALRLYGQHPGMFHPVPR